MASFSMAQFLPRSSPINNPYPPIISGDESAQQGRCKRIKIYDSNPTIRDEKTTLMSSDGLKLKFKLKPSKPPAKETPIALFNFSSTWASSVDLNQRLVSELDKIKRGLIYELKKVDESFALDVARKIEYNTAINNDKDPFVIKKELEVSDVNNHLNRLMLKKEQVQTFMLPILGAEQRDKIESGEGIRVSVYDQDTGSYHKMTFKRWKKSSNSYILNDNWRREAVERRKLEAGDCIGLYWDSFNSHLCFSVIRRRV